MKLKKTLIIVLAIVMLFGAFAVFDTVRASTFNIEVVSVSPEKPVADVRQQVEIKLRVTHGGNPVEGHSLYAVVSGGGNFKGNRSKTDAAGIAVLIYVPYTETMLRPARPVKISVIDESNSIFLEINSTLEFEINLQPKE